MEVLVRELLADGWFANLQCLPTGWYVLTDAPPWVMTRLAATQRVEIGAHRAIEVVGGASRHSSAAPASGAASGLNMRR